MSPKIRSGLKSLFLDCTGALGDGAILFPILFLLSSVCGYSETVLFLSSGVAYLTAGWFFKVPMPVQPLKSLALTGISLGASQIEMRLAAATLGLLFLLLSFLDLGRNFNKIPKTIIHSIQVGLGVILICQAFQIAGQNELGWLELGMVSGGVGVILLLAGCFPVLGLVALGAVVFSLQPKTSTTEEAGAFLKLASGLRPEVLFALVLPQIPLTLANSVLGTTQVAQQYWGKKARFVHPTSLLRSIGLGNLFFSSFGGIPFCHGAGGMTAHYQAGARTSRSNTFMGLFLIALGLALMSVFVSFELRYSPLFVVVLLACIGVFHLNLAKTSWESSRGKMILGGAAIAGALTRNMLVVLLVGVIGEMVWKASATQK